jgi:chromate transport protein ChrA
MGKKRPVGIAMIGYINILLPLFFLILLSFPSLSSRLFRKEVDARMILLSIFVVIAVLFIPVGISILRLRNSGRKQHMAIAIIAILALTGPHTIFFIIPYLYFILSLFYFTRPKVKALFK